MVLRQRFGTVPPLPVLSRNNNNNNNNNKTPSTTTQIKQNSYYNNHNSRNQYNINSPSPLSLSPRPIGEESEQLILASSPGQNGRKPKLTPLRDFSAQRSSSSSSSSSSSTSSESATSTCSSSSSTSNGSSSKRLKPLSIDEYERDFRRSASDLQLIDRVFYGGVASNELRAALWPYLFGLVRHRGRFRAKQQPPVASSSGQHSKTNGYSNHTNGNGIASTNGVSSTTTTANNNQEYVYVEHEKNIERWRELEKLYLSYEAQWKSIKPDQELRFSTFRERKSLIERDVIRSDRSHPFYADNSTNLANFTTLLMTYMMYDFDIGYLQGMSDIAAPILYVFQGDLVKSFWVFVEVMKLFRRNFEFSQKTIHFQLNCLYRLIRLTDPKFAHYLSQNECSNCFFAFRCIVCQFKRELMKCNQSNGPTNSAQGHQDDLQENDHQQENNNNNNNNHYDYDQRPSPQSYKPHLTAHNDDYANVLKLWDTIWCVQRRHELLSKSKCTHTFTIANGASNKRNHNSSSSSNNNNNNNYKLAANYQLNKHNNQRTHSSSQASPSAARLLRQQQPDSSMMSNGTQPTTKTHTESSQHNQNNLLTSSHSHNTHLNHHNNNNHQHQHANGNSTTGARPTSNGYNGQVATNGHHNNHNNHNHYQQTKQTSASTNGFSSTTTTTTTNSTATSSSPNFASHRQPSISSIRSNGSGRASPTLGPSPSLIGSYHAHPMQQMNLLNGSSDHLSPLSLSPASVSINNSPSINGSADSYQLQHQLNGCCKSATTTQPVKQEQIVYTKETFYSSFDPNQADVPRFELTETEKFMLSLCLSMIRRERDNILVNRMDATEIHQHFINPHLACDLNDFINQAYEIYEYLNTDCDLQRVVKGANEFANGGAYSNGGVGGASSANSHHLGAMASTANGTGLSPGANIGIDIQSEAGSWPKDSADTADTYDLLKDYLIISPHSYNTSTSSALANNNLIGSINYIGTNRQHPSSSCSNSHNGLNNTTSRYKPWNHFIDNPPLT